MADDKPIIVVKKKGGHGGHHGGAWKVAYADFITAMMAFFLVMWLLNSAETTTKSNIAKYFKKPGLFMEGSGSPLMVGEGGILSDAYVPPHSQESKNYHGKGQEPQDAKSGSDMEELEKSITLKGVDEDGLGEAEATEEKEKKPLIVSDLSEQPSQNATAPPQKMEMAGGKGQNAEGQDAGVGGKYSDADGGAGAAGKLMGERAALSELAQELQKRVSVDSRLEEILGDLEIKLESDGLIIEIMDSQKDSMFASGSPAVLPRAEEAFSEIAAMLADLPNSIDIIGHTDAKPFSSRGGYSNWELSADRANAARRLLVNNGIDPRRIVGVVGRADQDLKLPQDPFNAANRRITLKVRFGKETTIPINDLHTAMEKFKAEDQARNEAAQTPTLSPIETEPTPPPAALPTPTPVLYKNDRPKGIMAAESKKKSIQLPEQNSADDKSNNLIFGDNPVINEPPIFANF
ncbi:MAG: OmpA family protein [Deltaproteobacteria bacterium]|nr:OmpA family protein [Deltaproteobacteria bacterium]